MEDVGRDLAGLLMRDPGLRRDVVIVGFSVQFAEKTGNGDVFGIKRKNVFYSHVFMSLEERG